MEGRIGSTSPIPMKATTDAPAVAHTAFGCLRMPPVPASKGSMDGAPIRDAAGCRTPGRWLVYAHGRLARLINASYI
ncbi:hypothetical protein SGRIM128S_07351 [Streptomyces griseomycini]